MYSLDKRLAIYTALVSPFILLWIRYFRKIIFRLNNSIRELNSKINAKINELVTGVSVIQIFNKEETMLGEYNDLVLTTNKKQFTLNITNAVFGWELLVFIKRIGVAFIILYFGLNFMSPETVLTSGLIYAFIAYIDRIIEPINQIFNNINSLEDSKVAANRILTFLDEEEDFTSKQNLVPESLKSDVVFKNLTFSYIEGIQVLKNINLTVKNGEQIGIVGHTGSGKSSLMNLLCLFYNYKDGEILINNENISNYNKHEFRKKIGIVLQTPQLFKGTIKDNITMNDDSYSDEFLYSILEKIGALDIVDKYERRIYTEMSFKGDNLSVGEKQLISFARILLKNPDILILDEATANIDTETELKIKAAMNVISKNRTTFIIAHRLSTIKNCDRIIVLDKGKIVGVGKHEDLYINCNEYRKIHDSQYNNLTVKKA
jgi:ATP-binding cassette subfamily B protein